MTPQLVIKPKWSFFQSRKCDKYEFSAFIHQCVTCLTKCSFYWSVNDFLQTYTYKLAQKNKLTINMYSPTSQLTISTTSIYTQLTGVHMCNFQKQYVNLNENKNLSLVVIFHIFPPPSFYGRGRKKETDREESTSSFLKVSQVAYF